MEMGVVASNLGDYLDKPGFTLAQLETLRQIFRVMNRFMVFMWKIGLGKMINCWPAVLGSIMVIKNHGRRTGREYLTPVNYAMVDGGVYCTAGFGSGSDWYRNLLARPEVELWLPDGRHKACAQDVFNLQDRITLMRKVIIASGFAGPLFGVDQKKLSDEKLSAITKDYRLLLFKQEQ